MSVSPSPEAQVRGAVSKTRLPILDGLRGVAALLVVAFHIFDTEPSNPINHGYLAVDFFFMLSGYVMGYAYDDRWNGLSVVSFFKRRLVRLHPMVVIGTLIGAICFPFGASAIFPNVAGTSAAQLLLAVLMGALLIPAPKSLDVRGWGGGESFPLNGPLWSLFFEYVANIAYAFWLRRLRVLTLGVLASVLGVALAWITVSRGSISLGWEVSFDHQAKALVRLFFPFLTGLFLFRLGKRISLRHGAALTALVLTGMLAFPHVGPADKPWMNGLYESLVIIAVLPFIVLVGAGSPVSKCGEKLCDFLGELSYPLYLVHYPVCYVLFSWLEKTKPALGLKLSVSLVVYLGCLTLGWLVMRFVDAPVRRRLARFTR